VNTGPKDRNVSHEGVGNETYERDNDGATLPWTAWQHVRRR